MNNLLVQNEPNLFEHPIKIFTSGFLGNANHLGVIGGVIQFSWKPRGLFKIQNINYTVPFLIDRLMSEQLLDVVW